MLDHYANYDYLRPMLYSIKDISKFVRQIMLKKIAPKQLFQLYKNLKTILEIREKTAPECILETYLKRSTTCSNIEHINKYCELILNYLETNFVLEECEQLDSISSFETMFLKSGVNEELDEKIKLLNESREKMEAYSTIPE